ncbi:MAG TPA: hypothetical protein VF503_14125 [Sphingobium sp.]|uniref:hypothetical protein n=1 Tax=Sphingobium sp. TaxID=1912891 RepID=UPI002ED3377C
MIRTIVALSASAIILVGASCQASTPHLLNFRQMEYSQPFNPILPSSVESNFVQHTNKDDILEQSEMIRDAIPTGTDRITAESILTKAGAHCRPKKGLVEICRYFDVQIRDDYVDAVTWTIALNIEDEHVRNLSIDRTWLRN